MNPLASRLMIAIALALLVAAQPAPGAAVETPVAAEPADGLSAGAAKAKGDGTAPVQRKDVESQVNCTCEDDCGKLLANCICGFSGSMRKEIDAMIGAGMSKTEIFEALVKRYGGMVLASPGTSHWLDRLAWLAPFAALVLGALIVIRAVRRMVRKPAGEAPPAKPAEDDPEGKVASAYEQKLEDELSRFES